MKLREYLTETEPTKMPSKQLKYFKELVAEFKAGNPGYKYTSINGFMRDLEKDDYKSLSILFNGLGVKSIDEFVRKYKDYVDQVNESLNESFSPVDTWVGRLMRNSPSVRFSEAQANAEYHKKNNTKQWKEHLKWHEKYGKNYMAESVAFGSPKDQARKAKLDKVIRIKKSTAQYAHGEYTVELIGKEWPSNTDLLWYCDYPWGAFFGGRVEKGDKTAIVKVHTD